MTTPQNIHDVADTLWESALSALKHGLITILSIVHGPLVLAVFLLSGLARLVKCSLGALQAWHPATPVAFQTRETKEFVILSWRKKA